MLPWVMFAILGQRKDSFLDRDRRKCQLSSQAGAAGIRVGVIKMQPSWMYLTSHETPSMLC